MRILLLTQLFQPEPNHLKGLEFARELAGRGNDVEVLTGFPNYPCGRTYPGYRQKLFFRERMDGIPVIRVPVYPSHNSSGMARMLNYLSLVLTMIFPGLFRIRRPDVVHVYQGPATLAMPAMILRVLLDVPYVLDVQDLWPDSVESSGMLRFPGMTGILGFWSRQTYRFAQKIVVLSPGYKKALVERGVEPDKIEIVYNWCDERVKPDPAESKKIREIKSYASVLKVVYTGNMGPVQALGAVVGAAAILERRGARVRFLFIGDGADIDNLMRVAGSNGLTNIDFIPRQSPEAARRYIDEADAVLVHLKKDDLGMMAIPQKTQTYLSAGKPIIMAVAGDAAELVRNAQAGIVCEPEDSDSIASAIERLSRLSEEDRAELGQNGRKYYEENLSFRLGVARMAMIFAEAVR